MEVSSQLHAPTGISPEKEPPLTTGCVFTEVDLKVMRKTGLITALSGIEDRLFCP
jgi:hypothetical protein